MMYSVVIGFSNVHPNGLQDQPIAVGVAFDGVSVGDHGMSGTAQRAGICYVTVATV